MRISQLESFTPLELATLLYIVNEVAPVEPKMKFTPKLLLAFSNDKLISKLASIHDRTTEDGKAILCSIGGKLKKTWLNEVVDFRDASKPIFIQLEFNFNDNPPPEQVT